MREKITGTGGGTFTWHFAYTDESWLRSSAGLKGFAAFALQGAGTEHAAVNPVFFMAAVLLVLAWRNAGYYGLDRYVLPALGTPWHKGKVFDHTATPAPAPVG